MRRCVRINRTNGFGTKGPPYRLYAVVVRNEIGKHSSTHSALCVAALLLSVELVDYQRREDPKQASTDESSNDLEDVSIQTKRNLRATRRKSDNEDEK